jgi:hypothetical protein
MVRITKDVNLDTTIDVNLDAEDWFSEADSSEKQEMFNLLVAEGFSYVQPEDVTDALKLVKFFRDNHFLKQKVVFALKEFNSKENLTSLGDLIREIEDL